MNQILRMAVCGLRFNVTSARRPRLPSSTVAHTCLIPTLSLTVIRVSVRPTVIAVERREGDLNEVAMVH